MAEGFNDNSTSTATPILEALDISKRFPGVHALDDVSLTVLPGEIHAVVGENRAGKSTLMMILAGAHTPDQGTIHVAGQPVIIESPRAAQDLGISTIYQELSLVDALSVGENLFLGDLPTYNGASWRVDWPTVWRRSAELLERVGCQVRPQTLVRNLSVAQKQMVEIARALARNVRVLILDEPTSSLTERETKRLFEIIELLQQREVGIVYISHRLSEVFQIAHWVTVLRDGKLVGTVPAVAASKKQLVRMMVGRDLPHLFT
jgi:ABC-type sugar transport system ATPase subunit